MKIRIHAIAGAVAFATIATFWISTLLNEAFGGPEQIAIVKTAIL